MKHQNRWIALALTLLLLMACGTAAATDDLQPPIPPKPVFPNGATWDTSLADMSVHEGVDNVKPYLLNKTDTIEEYWFPCAWDGEGPVGTYYVFRNDQLACTGIDYCAADTGKFTYRMNELTMLYGPPEDIAFNEVVAMFNAYKGEDFPLEILYAVAGWTLIDGTKAYLLDIDGELYLFFAEENRLYSAAN